MRIEDMKLGRNNRHANVGTDIQTNDGSSSEQTKNGIFEKIRDFGGDNEDSYSQFEH